MKAASGIADLQSQLADTNTVIAQLQQSLDQQAQAIALKIREALENLQTKVEGVVTTYDKPFTHDDHEAITANIPIFGEVKGSKVVYAYEEDRAKGADIRTKVKKAAAADKQPAKK